MAITFTNLGASAAPDFFNNVNQASYATASWTPPTTGIILLFVTNHIAAVGNVPTVSGNSLTWTQIATIAIDPGTSHRITLFAADASGAAAGVTTIAFGGQTQLDCDASFFQAEGVDLSGGVAAAFVQSPNNNGTGTSGSVTLAAAGHADNRPIACFTHQAQEATTPDGAWTEADDLTGVATARGMETQWDADGFQNASASWTTSSAWLGMASELKATVGAAADPAFLPELHDTDWVTDDTEAQEYVFWLTPADVIVVEEQPARAQLEEQIADDVEAHDYSFWLVPGDVVDFQPLPELHDTDWGTDDTDAGWLRAAIEEVVVVQDFQALPALVESVAVYDDTLYQWAGWPLPAELPVEDFQARPELVESEVVFDDTLFNWTAGPNSLSGLPGFTIGLVRVTSTVKGVVVTLTMKAAKASGTYKGVRDGTTQ